MFHTDVRRRGARTPVRSDDGGAGGIPRRARPLGAIMSTTPPTATDKLAENETKGIRTGKQAPKAAAAKKPNGNGAKQAAPKTATPKPKAAKQAAPKKTEAKQAAPITRELILTYLKANASDAPDAPNKGLPFITEDGILRIRGEHWREWLAAQKIDASKQ